MIRPRWSHPPAPGRGEMAPSSARAEVQAADSLDTSGSRAATGPSSRCGRHASSAGARSPRRAP
eukprot:CAMPEP_0195579172 /NCGR_PEP_ID=MMETSP0814-20130614/13871_1 /TAXON_ID=97485 /ORGANISM="Prymnesium parvum, Strain Texoma1" /LENGTH=63 /DNA_ID=CAMNT_0040715865 /DNA_START=41 /DNA_END=229 /DNA_ORIENTATION=+